MKKLFAFAGLNLCLLSLVFSLFAQDYKTVRDGIEYAELTREIDKTPVRMNLLRLDLKKVRLDVVHAMDAAIGLEKTSSIATRHGAFAAINAGFFRIDRSIFEGDNVGFLQIDGKFFSESLNDRAALLIKNSESETQVAFDKLNAEVWLEVSDNLLDAIIAKGINRQRRENDFVIFTPEFHRTTLTDNQGTEIIVRHNKVVKISKGKGNNLIPEDGFVISLSDSIVPQRKDLMKVGKKIRYSGLAVIRPLSNQNISGELFSEDIISGVPQLIKNGKIDITWQEEKSSKSFVETKHPRTAVAKLKDGKFLMVTIDGRSESSGGIALPQLAEILLEFGATDAMNFDGGGSTTMFLDGKIVNRPSDKEGERKVGDAILVFPRK